jgi:hypothetical protein
MPTRQRRPRLATVLFVPSVLASLALAAGCSRHNTVATVEPENAFVVFAALPVTGDEIRLNATCPHRTRAAARRERR